MAYDVPGFADQATAAVKEAWNALIAAEYDRQARLHSRFFTLDPASLAGAGDPVSVHWPASPAEPRFCRGEKVAQKLSDWGVRGRHATHNEYCEYTVIYRADSTGRMRPKRVELTTELREYWLCLAVEDPQLLRAAAKDALGYAPPWVDLYGGDPMPMSREARGRAFTRMVAGSGKSGEVPEQPIGRLNRERALFMSHPINGLDDLLYIVLFGATPYAVSAGAPPVPASRDDIFRAFKVEHLACRNADPNACMAAQQLAWAGSRLAFANPLGSYFASFASDTFQFKDKELPEEWVRWRRGRKEGLYQRLEFGPGDDEPHFLEEILAEPPGASAAPVTGGYQVAQAVEVGPLVVFEAADPPAANDIRIVPDTGAEGGIACAQAGVCKSVRALEKEYNASMTPTAGIAAPIGPRGSKG